MNVYVLFWISAFIVASPPVLTTYVLQIVGGGSSLYLYFFVLSCFFVYAGFKNKVNIKYVFLIPLTIGLLYYYSSIGSGNSDNIKVRETYLIFYTLAALIFIFSVFAIYDSEKIFVGGFIKIFKYCSLFTAIIGIFQYANVIGESDIYPGVGMMGHKNHYGYICSLGFLIAISDFKNKISKFNIFIVFTMLIAVVISMCRGAWFLSIVFLFVYFVVNRNIAMLAAVGVAGLILFGALEMFPEFADRLNQSDISSGRYDLWEQLLPSGAREILWGRGAGFMWTLTQYDISEQGGYVGEHNDYIYAHNDFIFLMVEIGVVGSILWAGLCLGFLLFYGYKLFFVDQKNIFSYIGFCVTLALIFSESVDTVFFGARNIYVYLSIMVLCSGVGDRFAVNKSSYLK